MRATGARLAGQALCFVGCSKAKPLSHQLSNAAIYVNHNSLILPNKKQYVKPPS